VTKPDKTQKRGEAPPGEAFLPGGSASLLTV